MKKLLFLLLLIPFNVFAINYSPYSEYKYTDNYIKGNDNCEVQELKKYKFYKLEKDYTDNYFNSSFNDNYYIYKDSNFIYSNLISSNIKPDINEVTELNEKTLTYYQEYNKLRYIILNNFNFSNYLKIKEIYIYDKNNNLVNFDVIKGSSGVGDNNKKTSVTVNKDDIYILKLDKDMDFNDFYVVIFTAGKYTSTFSLDYNLNYTGEFNDIYYYGNIEGELSSEDRYHIKKNESNYLENLNSEIKVKEGYFNSIDNAKIIKYEKIYSYKEKLYKYYNYKKVYLDDYYFEKEDYIKDLNNYKTTYRYRCRTVLNNVVDDEKKGFCSKDEYFDFKNKRDEVINKITINKTDNPLNTKIIKNDDIDINKENNDDVKINIINIKDKDIDTNDKDKDIDIDTNDKDIEYDKYIDNSSKLYKLIIIFLGLMIIFII